MKRFTETGKWEDPWFRKLTPAAKLLWGWITDKCDAAGIIDLDLELATFQTGLPVDEFTLAELLTRLHRLECGKWHITGFIQFQYGKLSRDCKPHDAIFRSLEKHRVSSTLPDRVSDTLPERVQEKEKEKEKERRAVSYSPEFLSFWDAYPRKNAKGDAWRAWKRIKPMPDTGTILSAVARDIASAEWQRDNGAYIPHPASWLNGRRWEDEGMLPIATQPTQKARESVWSLKQRLAAIEEELGKLDDKALYDGWSEARKIKRQELREARSKINTAIASAEF